MERRTYSQEWRDEQARSKYPFADRCTLRSDSGNFLDGDTFLDAVLHPINGPARLFLTSAVCAGDGSVTLAIGDAANPRRATTEFPALDPPEELPLEDALGRPAGLLVSTPDRLAAFRAWGLGTHTFGDRAEFVSACVVPVPGDGLRGILLDDGTLLTGDVWLVGEGGAVVRQDEDGSIRVDVVGDPLFRRRLCEPGSQFRTPRFIRTVNGRPPDARGDFQMTVNSELAGDTILRIYPDDDGQSIRVEVVGQKAGGA